MQPLHGAEEGDEEGDAEIDKEAVEDGKDHDVAAGDKGDDGQSGVHRRGPGHGYWGVTPEPPHKQRGAEQGYEFAGDVGEQGHRAEGRAPVFGDENAGKGIITEAAAYGEAVSKTVAGKQPGGKGDAAKRAGDGDKGEQEQPGVDGTDAAEHAGVAADAHADEEHEGAKGVETDVADIRRQDWHKIENADNCADNEETDDDKTVTHCFKGEKVRR